VEQLEAFNGRRGKTENLKIPGDFPIKNIIYLQRENFFLKKF